MKEYHRNSVLTSALSLLVLTPMLGLLLLAASAQAQWLQDGAAVCTIAGYQDGPKLVQDGAGGAIVTWHDNRSGNWDVYAQRVSESGYIQWPAIGAAVCTTASYQYPTQPVSDGVGGAIIAWAEPAVPFTNWKICVQRIKTSGNVLWGTSGLALRTDLTWDGYPSAASDGAGGAIVAWQDYPSGSPGEIHAQRVDADGNVLWTTSGVIISAAHGSPYYPQIESDGAGGAIVTWQEYRGTSNIYAQRVNANGNVLWTTDGVAICTAPGNQYSPKLVSDGDGGAIVAWFDVRSDGSEVYAQRVDANGSVKWITDGVIICAAPGVPVSPSLVSDGDGGAIVTWQDSRSGSDYDIYAQRVRTDGSVKWTTNGSAICTASGDQYVPQLTSDVGGGAIITWSDSRGANRDIYVQKVDSSGAALWTADGVAICTATGDQLDAQIASDGSGGVIISWQDDRGDGDIYAQRMGPDGSIISVVGPVAPRISPELYQNVPNPFNPITCIKFSIKQPSQVRLRVFDATGKPMRTLVDSWHEPGVYTEVWDGRNDAGKQLSSGIYFYRLEAGDFVAMRKLVLLR
jgi:hypothetical protein